MNMNYKIYFVLQNSICIEKYDSQSMNFKIQNFIFVSNIDFIYLLFVTSYLGIVIVVTNVKSGGVWFVCVCCL